LLLSLRCSWLLLPATAAVAQCAIVQTLLLLLLLLMMLCNVASRPGKTNASLVTRLSVEAIKIQTWVQQVGWSGVPARESDEATASSKSRQEGDRQQGCQAQPELDGAAAGRLQERRAGEAGEVARGASLCRHVQVWKEMKRKEKKRLRLSTSI